ncbi:MAG: low molecular weight phosphotyrosine protein phosphatase [Firmicutes bacterium]|nr:low molecular weight phosphotyrosine protein phosphatase [Bacillota bacterium]MDY5855899.1 low molecular weight protein-tyrosine-phosphatase [Anaerovoracaceae bacterium]
MINVLMICHGNICRSPMAEYVLKDMVRKQHLADRFCIASAATSREEIGNDVHRGTRRKLAEEGIACPPRHARQVTKADYADFDYLLIMDENNRRNLLRILGGDPEHKIHGMLDWSERPRDIADPWYTGNFDITYDDIVEGCETFLQHLKENGERYI